MAKERTLAFDVGGTKIASAVVEMEGDHYALLGYRKEPTPSSARAVVSRLAALAAGYREEYTFSRLGVAIAGQVDAAEEEVIFAPNIEGFKRLHLGRLLAQKTGLLTTVRNDVRCFALGEDRFGKYGGHENALYLAVGTGVGGAIKLAGKFYFGGDNIAGEFGHMVVVKEGEPCHCGRRGCFEQYVAGPGVERMYREMHGERLGAKEIVFAAVRGEAKARAVMERASSYFATGLANLVDVLDPEIVVVGGSMVKEKRLLRLALPLIRREVLPSARRIKIVNSSLGDEAFLLGAAAR